METELLLTREALRIRLIPISKSKQGYACLFNKQIIVEVICILGELGVFWPCGARIIESAMRH